MDPSDLLDLLAACLSDQIKESRTPDVCFVGVVPGESPVAESIGECSDGRQGMAWVRSTLIYPASGVNLQNQALRNCNSGVGMDIEMGMLRPAPVAGNARGDEPVTPEQHRNTMLLQNDDAMTMWRAATCCMDKADVDYVLGSYAPAGILGGAVGGTWGLAVILDS